MNTDKIEQIVKDLEGFVTDLRPTPTDDIADGPILEVQLLDRWFLVDENTWRSWTGRRRVDGEDFHGEIFYLDSDRPYAGTRSCPCTTCQSSVDPRQRKN
jgi:hypothetical protein